MGLRMKNLNIMGVHWKTWFLSEGFMKNQYIEGMPKKEGLGQLADLKIGRFALSGLRWFLATKAF